MNYTITKLDRRHSYNLSFEYMIEFRRRTGWAVGSSSGVLEYDRARRWFNQTFGWSQDVETQQEIIQALANRQLQDFDQETDFNPTWSYSIKYGEYRIYIRDEKTLNWFVLSHPCPQR